MKSIKVRFNLGKGKNYMKWKIQYPDGKVEYHQPTDIQLVMNGCVLKNQKKTAVKIFEGSNKTVCAWILCQSIQIRKDLQLADNQHRVRYNPRIAPNWVTENGENADGMEFDEIYSVNSNLFVGSKKQSNSTKNQTC